MADVTAAPQTLAAETPAGLLTTADGRPLKSALADAQARADYLALLDDLETTFADRSRRLLSDNRSDLDVEISVLRDRLKYET